MAEALQLTATQKRIIAQQLIEERKKARIEETKLSDDVLRTCIKALTPDQQAAYYRLVGKPFDVYPVEEARCANLLRWLF